MTDSLLPNLEMHDDIAGGIMDFIRDRKPRGIFFIGFIVNPADNTVKAEVLLSSDLRLDSLAIRLRELATLYEEEAARRILEEKA